MLDDGEIVRSYESAKDKTKQISILAELNCCSKSKILSIIGKKRGEIEPQQKSRNQNHLIDRLDELDEEISQREKE